MKSDPRTYHMDGFPMGYEPPDGTGHPENATQNDMSGKKEWVEFIKSGETMEWSKTCKRNADGADELVGNKKLCTEGSESLNVLLSLIEPIILMCLRI
jgi:hypothetical protein